MSVTKNTWAKDQERKKNALGTRVFQPKWNQDTVEFIIGELTKNTPAARIKVLLVKEYEINSYTASLWIEMSRRIKTDIAGGLNMLQAIENDKQRRKMKWRKPKTSLDSSIGRATA